MAVPRGDGQIGGDFFLCRLVERESGAAAVAGGLDRDIERGGGLVALRAALGAEEFLVGADGLVERDVTTEQRP